MFRKRELGFANVDERFPVFFPQMSWCCVTCLSLEDTWKLQFEGITYTMNMYIHYIGYLIFEASKTNHSDSSVKSPLKKNVSIPKPQILEQRQEFVWSCLNKNNVDASEIWRSAVELGRFSTIIYVRF